MPIDPNTGLFSYGEPSFSPGPSSPGLGGLVSLLNALQGQQNRQEALASQRQAEEANIFKSSEAGLTPTEENTTPFGISGERAAAITGMTPRAKFQAALAAKRTADPTWKAEEHPDEVATMQAEASGAFPSGA